MAKVALELVVALLLIAALVRVVEPRLAFFPTPGESLSPREFGVTWEPISIPTADGEQLHAWMLSHPSALATIVYFHGNGGNLSIWAPILTAIEQQGFSVLAVDYRGYGLSSGRPTERGLYRDVDAVIDRLRRTARPAGPVVYWGRSLGVVMAAYAATIEAPDGLILEAGFPDAHSLVRTSPLLALLSVFSSYRFPCASFLARVNAPVLVMHGTDDRVIPIAHGQALFDRIPGPKKFVAIPGADHNDAEAPDPRAYWRSIHEFIHTLGHTRPGE